MSRRALIAAATAGLAALLVFGALTPARAAGPSADRRVTIVLVPYMTWDKVVDGTMPATARLAGSSAVGLMNVRGNMVAGSTTLARAALQMSAGTPAVADAAAWGAYGMGERFDETSTARDVYARVYGRAPSDGELAYLGLPLQLAANAQSSLGAVPGALGATVRSGGGQTVAVGNSDLGFATDDLGRNRPAVIVGMDARGMVGYGDVSEGLLDARDPAPFGVRTDVSALLKAYDGAMEQATSRGGGVLAVVDPGDLARWKEFSSIATTDTAAAYLDEALRSADEVIGALGQRMGPDDTLIVAALVSPDLPDQPAPLSPVLVKGAGRAGFVRAASTHRVGMVSVLDVTATALDALGMVPPGEVTGSVIGSTGGSADTASRLSYLQGLGTTVSLVEVVRFPLTNTFITITVLLLLAAGLYLSRVNEMPPVVGKALEAGLLLALCFGLGERLVLPLAWGTTPTLYAVGLLGIAALCWGVLLVAVRGRAAGTRVAIVTTAMVAAVLLDQWAGAPLSITGAFSYSPLFGARYYGIGNEMAGLLFGAFLVSSAYVLDTWRGRPAAEAFRRWGFPLAGGVVTLTATLPFLGANVGCALWMVPGVMVMWAMVNGRKVFTVRNVAAVVVTVVALLALLSAIDLLGSAGSETHLGRTLQATEGGGIGAFAQVVYRKAETNLRVLTRTNWAYLLAAVLGLLAYMRWRPRGGFKEMLEAFPGFSAAMAGAILAGLVGGIGEDSGIIVPALVMLPVGVAAVTLMLGEARRAEGERA